MKTLGKKTQGLPDGLKAKYRITKADGTPCEGRYFVLRLDSKDPVHARASMRALLEYSRNVSGFEHLAQLGEDIWQAVHDHVETDDWAVWDELIGGVE
jgi:hypothetical protein